MTSTLSIAPPSGLQKDSPGRADFREHHQQRNAAEAGRLRRNKGTRYKVAVSIDRDGGDGEELAFVFIAPAQRVTDVLNDERDFLPFERPDGSLFVVAKRTIRCITPLEMGRRINAKDPYDLLGITLAATDEEVHEAYRRSIAAVHPDRVYSLGLPQDFLEMATRRAAQLNDAYRKIRALRKAEMASR